MSFTPLTFQGEISTPDSIARALIQLQSQIDAISITGTGTVTSVSVVTANGMSGTVATPTTTPAITLVVGAINLATATGLPEAGLSLTNITTNNVSITKHGFAPILPNDATKYLDGTGAYTVPAGSSGITIGTTTITGGTTTRLLYDAAGVVGEITGATSNGTALTLVAPVLGTPASGTLTNCTGLPAAGVVGTAAILGANTFTALQTITQASANAGIIASTGYSLTGSNATNMLDFAGTWNTSGAPTALKVAITNTASGATARLVSILAGAGGATEMLGLVKTGQLLITAVGTGGSPDLGWLSGSNNTGFRLNGTGIEVLHGGTNDVSLASVGLGISNTGFVFFCSAAPGNGGGRDVGFARSAAGLVEVNDANSIGTHKDIIARSVFMDGTSASTASAGQISLSGGTQSTVGAAGGASALPATPTGYIKINVAGTAMVVPYYAAA